MRRYRRRSGVSKELLLLFSRVVDVVVELLDGVDEENGSCACISLLIPKNKNTADVDVPTAAATVKHPAATQMNLNP